LIDPGPEYSMYLVSVISIYLTPVRVTLSASLVSTAIVVPARHEGHLYYNNLGNVIIEYKAQSCE